MWGGDMYGCCMRIAVYTGAGGRGFGDLQGVSEDGGALRVGRVIYVWL